MPAPTPRGRFLWHELMTTDTKAAARFYKAVVGWGTSKWKLDPSYRVWTGVAGPVAGLMTLPPDAQGAGAAPSWLTYVGTPNVDTTVLQAMSMGARVLTGPLDVPGVGRVAVIADPQSAVFAAYTAAGDPPGHDGAPEIGEFSWHELATTDYRKAFDFYRALFGWLPTQSVEIEGIGTYFMFGRAGVSVGGIYSKPPHMKAPPQWLPYARVRSADTAARKAKALGAEIVSGPHEVTGGDRIAICIDPEGAAFAFHSIPKAGATATPKKATQRKPPKRAAKRSAANKRTGAKRRR
jgi:predicted enzyme related to lactoylglutathione lyase